MEKQRQIKILSIVALVLAICALSLGYAAFSTSLKISSSASVSPNSGDFNVVFSNSSTSVLGSGESVTIKGNNGGGVASEGQLTATRVSRLKGNFESSGDMVDYLFYVHNVGEYDAYLKGINIEVVDGTGSTKVCEAATTDETKATDSLVQATCENVHLYIMVGDYEYEVGDTNIVGHKLEKGSVQEVMIVMDYVETGTMADGPFNVIFGDLSLEFSTVDNQLISISIDSMPYQVVEGMTFVEWVNSSYNTKGFVVKDNTIFLEGEGYLYNSVSAAKVNANDVIVEDEEFFVFPSPTE